MKEVVARINDQVIVLNEDGTMSREAVTDETWCDKFRRLDAEYGTDKRSPLHHDNRCQDH